MKEFVCSKIFSCAMQLPWHTREFSQSCGFLVYTIHEQTLAVRLRRYVSSGQTKLVDNWRKLFHRAIVIVFPSYILAVAYSACDPGNYLVIPGSPAEAWKAYNLMDPLQKYYAFKYKLRTRCY
ncbi:hypothetical protein ACS0TY_026400 [Phlomoides rotata]